MYKKAGFYKKSYSLVQAILKFIIEQKKVTVRQVFYNMVVQGLVPNKITVYKNIDIKINKMRFANLIPFDSIIDTTKFYGTNQYDSLENMIEQLKSKYRSNWDEEFDTHIEVWLEKQALANIIHPITDYFGVFLSVSGGRTKVSQVHSCITERMNCTDKPMVILYLGDYDPTGLRIVESLTEQFKQQSGYIS